MLDVLLQEEVDFGDQSVDVKRLRMRVILALCLRGSEWSFRCIAMLAIFRVQAKAGPGLPSGTRRFTPSVMVAGCSSRSARCTTRRTAWIGNQWARSRRSRFGHGVRCSTVSWWRSAMISGCNVAWLRKPASTQRNII